MAPPGSRPGSSARPGSAGVLYHHHHSANGKAAAAVVAAKVPGTPSRREQSHRLEKAVQDPGLKDYVGGDLLLPFFLSFFGCVCSCSTAPFSLPICLYRSALSWVPDRVCTTRPYIRTCRPYQAPTYCIYDRPVAWRPTAGFFVG